MAYSPDPDRRPPCPFAVFALVAAFAGIGLTIMAAPLLYRTALALIGA